MWLVCVGGGNAGFLLEFLLAALARLPRHSGGTFVSSGVIWGQGLWIPYSTSLHTAGCLSIVEIALRLYRIVQGEEGVKGQLSILLLTLSNTPLREIVALYLVCDYVHMSD